MQINYNLIDEDFREETNYKIAYYAQANNVKYDCSVWSKGELMAGVYLSPDNKADILDNKNELKFAADLAKSIPGIAINLHDIAGRDRSILCQKKGGSVFVFYGEGKPTEIAANDANYSDKVAQCLQYVL